MMPTFDAPDADDHVTLARAVIDAARLLVDACEPQGDTWNGSQIGPNYSVAADYMVALSAAVDAYDVLIASHSADERQAGLSHDQ